MNSEVDKLEKLATHVINDMNTFIHCSLFVYYIGIWISFSSFWKRTVKYAKAVINYTACEAPWTHIIEHKWFKFGKDMDGNIFPKTIISREYSSEWKLGMNRIILSMMRKMDGFMLNTKNLLTKKKKLFLVSGRIQVLWYGSVDSGGVG